VELCQLTVNALQACPTALQDHQDLQDQLAKPDNQVHQVAQEMTELQAKLLLLAHHKTHLANRAQLDHPDLPDKTDPLDHPALMDNPEPQELAEAKDHPDQLDLPEMPDHPDNQEPLDNLDNLAKTAPDQPAHPDQPDQAEDQDQPDHPDQMEAQDSQEATDHQDQPDNPEAQDNQEATETQDKRDRMVFQEAMPLTALAHHVPLSSSIVNRVVQLPSLISLLLLFIQTQKLKTDFKKMAHE